MSKVIKAPSKRKRIVDFVRDDIIFVVKLDDFLNTLILFGF